MKNRQVKILPGNGWMAVIATRNPDSQVIGFRCVPLVCWQVKRKADGTAEDFEGLGPMHHLGTIEELYFEDHEELIKNNSDAEQVEEIALGYIHPSETSWEKRAQQAAEQAFQDLAEWVKDHPEPTATASSK